MATKEEWVKVFEATLGRKPTAEEYSNALKSGFDTSAFSSNQQTETIPPTQKNSVNPSENWAKLFESVTGRKPTGEEFMKAKATGFDVSQLAGIANNQPAPSPSSVKHVSPVQPQSVKTDDGQASASAEQIHQSQQTIGGQKAGQGQPVNTSQAAEAGSEFQQQAIQGQASTSQTSAAQQGTEAVQANFEQSAQQSQADFSQQPNAQQWRVPQASQQGLPNTDFQQPDFPGIQQPKQSSSNLVLGIILPIVSLVLSVLFAALSFTGAAAIFLGLSVLGLIGAIVLVILNIKGKKLLSIIAGIVAFLSVIVSIFGLVVNSSHSSSKTTGSSQVSKKASSVKDNSSDVDDYIDKDYKFEWKQSQVEDVSIEKDTVSDIVEKHGKATTANISDKRLTLIYADKSDKTSSSDDDETGYDTQSVTVTFKKVKGKWVVDSATGQFKVDDIDVAGDSYKSDWTKSDYDALKEGDYSTGDGGTKWSDIKKKHPKPSSAFYTVDNYSKEGNINKGLKLTYTDYDADDSHADIVILRFVESSDGKDYYLTNKTGSGAGISQ